jgi:putative ABC transport system permease protein
MFIRVLRDSLFRQKRRKAVVFLAVALGTASAAALADIALDVGDKMNRELKAFGANLVVVPKESTRPVRIAGEDLSRLRPPSYLSQDQVLKVKDNFWKNNILSLAPILDLTARVNGRDAPLAGTWFEREAAIDAEGKERFLAGVKSLNPFWSVRGDWPADLTAEDRRATPVPALVGTRRAAALGIGPGDRITIEGSAGSLTGRVAGILATGGDEDEAILLPLEAAWELSGLPGRVSRVLVSALTTPEDAVYARLGKNPRELPPAEFEKWSCTPFVSSIAYEIEHAVPGAEARAIRRVADTEGRVLGRISGLMILIAVMAAVASALTVTSALTASVLERRSEFGLLKAMGAGNSGVVALLLAEAGVVGLLGGLAGAGVGALMARWLSVSVFGAAVAIRPLSVPLAVAAALGITLAGCVLPAKRIFRLRPFELLRGL